MTIYYEPVICFISKSDSEDALKQDTQEGTIKFFGFLLKIHPRALHRPGEFSFLRLCYFRYWGKTNTTNSLTLIKVQHSSFPS